jgi:hypothetical protein
MGQAVMVHAPMHPHSRIHKYAASLTLRLDENVSGSHMWHPAIPHSRIHMQPH